MIEVALGVLLAAWVIGFFVWLALPRSPSPYAGFDFSWHDITEEAWKWCLVGGFVAAMLVVWIVA